MATATTTATAQVTAEKQTAYTVTEAASLMKLSATHFYRLIRQGRVPCAERISRGMIVLPVEAFETWLSRGGLSAPAENQ